MINVCVKKTKARYIGLDITGHANQDEYGKDIVCASVSSLSQTLLVSLAELCDLEDGIEYSVDSGDLKFKLPKSMSDSQIHDSNLLIKSFLIGIKGILEVYPEYLYLKVEEVFTYDD